MLKAMRKHAKYFYVLFVLVILSFIFWGIGPGGNNGGAPPLAEVGKQRITTEEYWRAVDNMTDVYREVYGELDDEKLDELKQTVLSTMIDEAVLVIAAYEAGLSVTDRELEEAIMNEPAFMRDGVFRSDVYKNTLRLNRLTPVYFESLKRRQLMLDKMKRLITESVDLVSEEMKGLPRDGDMAVKLREVLLEQKRQAALRSYIEGVKKEIPIRVNQELIS